MKKCNLLILFLVFCLNIFSQNTTVSGIQKYWDNPQDNYTISDIPNDGLMPKKFVPTTIYGNVYVELSGVQENSGSGTMAEPYKSIEYAISQTNTHFNVSGDATINNDTIKNISTTNCTVGMPISGFVIPYGSHIIEILNSTNLIINKKATATNTVSFSVWQIKKFIIVGYGVVFGNILKDGIVYDFGSSNIVWDDFILFNSTNALNNDLIVFGGNFFGGKSTSRFWNATYISKNTTFINCKVQSNTTGKLINIIATGGDIEFQNCTIDASLGEAFYLSTDGAIKIKNTKVYGFLMGIQSVSSNANCNLIIDKTSEVITPLTINAIYINSAYGHSWDIQAYKINGNFVSFGQSRLMTHYFDSYLDGSVFDYRNNGTCRATIKGAIHANVSIFTNWDWLYYGSFMEFSPKEVFGTLTKTGTGSVICNSKIDFKNLTVSGGDITFNNEVLLSGFLGTSNITGTAKVYFKGGLQVWVFYKYGSLTLNSADCLVEINNYLKSTHNEPSIIKTSGTLILRNCDIRTPTNVNVIFCSANTSASQDIYVMNCTTNCNATTYGLLFPFNGSSFAPNPLILNNLNESTTYTW